MKKSLILLAETAHVGNNISAVPILDMHIVNWCETLSMRSKQGLHPGLII
jgi:hypothetical protein